MRLTRAQLDMLKLLEHPTLRGTIRSIWQVGGLRTAQALQRLGLVTIHNGDGSYESKDKHSCIEITDAGREAHKTYKGGN